MTGVLKPRDQVFYLDQVKLLLKLQRSFVLGPQKSEFPGNNQKLIQVPTLYYYLKLTENRLVFKEAISSVGSRLLSMKVLVCKENGP